MEMAKYNCSRDVLIEALRKWRKKRILVIGDLILDRFIWGSVRRISPEAPVPVVDIREETAALGGASNVSANIRHLGGTPIPLGIMGSDPDGRTLQKEFQKLGIARAGLVIDPKRATTVKTRIIAHQQQVCRTDREDRSPMSVSTQDKVLAHFRANLNTADGVIISDYAKGTISADLLKKVLPLADAAGKIVCVDPKVRNLGFYRPATVITPNTLEAEHASGMTISNTKDLVRAGKKIMRQTGIQHLLVTRGEEGMTLFDRRSGVTHIPTDAREVFDVTGAGDTVVATLTLGLVAGLSILEAAILANIAAGIVVGKLGTASVSPEEILARIPDNA